MDMTENGMKSGQTTEGVAGGASHGLETARDADVAHDSFGAAGSVDGASGEHKAAKGANVADGSRKASECAGVTFGSRKAPESADIPSSSPKAHADTNVQSDASNGGQRTAEGANAQEDAECAWRTLYEPVERAIVEEHERRVAGRARRQREKAEEEKRAKGDLLEATEGLSAVWERETWTYGKMAACANGNPLILSCLAETVRKKATRLIDRLRHAERRSTYYEAENARRRALAEERRRIRKRTTTNSCPTREQILDGWLHRSDSHEATIRFGSLMMDLECHLDNSLIFDDDGAIAGRRGGVKRWLQENIPALYLRYTTVMRFKAAAQKLRQIAELRDPVPAATIVDPPSESDESDGVRLRRGRIADGTEVNIPQSSTESQDDVRLRRGGNPVAGVSANRECTESMESPCDRNVQCDGRTELRRGRDSVVHARAVWKEVVAGIGPTPTALMARIDALLAPQRTVEEGGMLAEWRRRHGAEVAARAKPQVGAPPGWPRPADSNPRHRTA